MQAKLTLRLDDDLIQSAKHYAAREGRSVSALVASYFQGLSESLATNSPHKTTPKSKFYGVFKGSPTASQLLEKTALEDANAHRKIYAEYLQAKHQ